MLSYRILLRQGFTGGMGSPIRIIGVVALVVSTSWMTACSAVHNREALTSDAAPSSTADLTAVTPEMVVGRASFPADAIGKWTVPYMYDEPSGAGSDEGCAPLAEGWEHSSDAHALASLDAEAVSRRLRYRVDLILPYNQDHRDIASVIESCRTLDGQGEKHVQVRRETVSDIPSWATAYTINASDVGGPASATTIAGQYRGIDIKVAASRNDSASSAADVPAVVKLFNDQVAILESQQ